MTETVEQTFKKPRNKFLYVAIGLIVVAIASTFFYVSTSSESVPPKGSVIPPDELDQHGNLIDYVKEGGDLELPVIGASGYASIELDLYKEPNLEAQSLQKISAGQGFRVIEEKGQWWHVENEEFKGWVEHEYCLINIVDVIPSIVFKNTNSYGAVFTSSGKDIPNISGNSLYESKFYNERFDEELHVIPAMYSTAKKVFNTQQAALTDGNTLILYESYRPYATQRSIVDNFRTLINTDPEVKAGVNQPPWTINWFISTGISNHQRGYAIDTSLGKVLKQELKATGKYVYRYTAEYEEYEMHTPIHELSAASAVFKTPVSGSSDEAWRKVELVDEMTEHAILLQKYATESGLSPLASEWWHFNDLKYLEIPKEKLSVGNFFIQTNHSSSP